MENFPKGNSSERARERDEDETKLPETERGVELRPEAPKQQTFEKGEEVPYVTFTRTSQGNLVSSAPGRKAFLISGDSLGKFSIREGYDFDPDESTARVRVLRDTKPGKPDGVIVVELIEPDSAVRDNSSIDSVDGQSFFDDDFFATLPDSNSTSNQVEPNPFAVLAALRNPETSRPQRVETLSDLPQTITLREKDLATTPQHENLLQAQAARLRTPALQTALRLAHQEIGSYSGAEELLRRAGEMRATAELEEGEKHRHFTALGAAIYREPKAAQLFNAGIDVMVGQKSDAVRSWLEGWNGEEPPLLPTIVIGTGPHGATFLSTYALYAPEGAPALAVDDRDRIGGQFATAEKAVFRMNSRNRPQMTGDQREERNLPGTEQTINPLGTMATMQVSDLSGETYVPQNVLANATRFNEVVSTDQFLTKCRLIATQNVTRADGSDVARCSFLDEEGQRVYTIDTDNLVIASGIGKDDFKLAGKDFLTEEQLEREKLKKEQGIRPVVMSFGDMIDWVGDPSKPSPLRDIKTAVVSGSGDGANVAVGILLGYEPGSDRMPVALDRVEKVYWVGQGILTKEDWLTSVRARYAQIGLEMPREIEGYYSRIVPVPDVKVNDLIVFNKDRSVVRADDNPPLEQKDEVTLLTSDEYRITGDVYISCTGFTDELPNVLVNARVRNERSITRDAIPPEFVQQSGAMLTSKEADIVIRVVSAVPRSGRAYDVELLVTTTRGTVLRSINQKSVLPFEGQTLVDDLVRAYTPESTLFEYSVPTTSPLQYETIVDEEGFPVAKTIAGSRIFLLGPAAAIPVSQGEIEQAPVLGTIPENTAALFRYGRGTENLARGFAKSLQDNGGFGRFDALPGSAAIPVRAEAGKRTEVTASLTRLAARKNENPYHISDTDTLRIALTEHLNQLRIPASVSALDLVIDFTEGDEFTVTLPELTVDGSGNVPGEILTEWLTGVVEDEYIRTALQRTVTERRKKRIAQAFSTQVEANAAIRRANQFLSPDQQIQSQNQSNSATGTLKISVPVNQGRPVMKDLVVA